MNNDLFFHIHYCNGKKQVEPGKFISKIVRTLPHHELMFFCNGSGSLMIEKKKYPIKKGTLLYIHPDAPYSIEVDAKVPAGCLTVHFSCARVRYNDGTWDIQTGNKKLSRHPARELKDAFLVEEQFQRLVDCWNEKLPGYEFNARTMFQQLLIVISQNINKQSRNYAASLKVERIIQYMYQNIDKKISLPELSELAQMSPAYMSRAFKETTGYTIIEFFTKLKIDKAKEMLLEGTHKVKDIAQSLNFTDEFYFSRIFKKIVRINPSEFNSRIMHEN